MTQIIDTYKQRAKRLGGALQRVLNIDTTHSQRLELIAHEENYPNWDALIGTVKNRQTQLAETPKIAYTFAELSSEICGDILQSDSGLVVVYGAVGSGKKSLAFELSKLAHQSGRFLVRSFEHTIQRVRSMSSTLKTRGNIPLDQAEGTISSYIKTNSWVGQSQKPAMLIVGDVSRFQGPLWMKLLDLSKQTIVVINVHGTSTGVPERINAKEITSLNIPIWYIAAEKKPHELC